MEKWGGMGIVCVSPTLLGRVLDGHVLEADDILVRQQLEQLDLSQGGDGKLDGDMARLADKETTMINPPRPLYETYAVFLVVHDDLLEGHEAARLARAGTVDLTGCARVTSATVERRGWRRGRPRGASLAGWREEARAYPNVPSPSLPWSS